MPHAQHGSASATIQLGSVSEYFAKCNGEPVRAEAALRFVCVTPPHVRGVRQRAEFASSRVAQNAIRLQDGEKAIR